LGDVSQEYGMPSFSLKKNTSGELAAMQKGTTQMKIGLSYLDNIDIT
jgi:hypothetical protein